ncbi:hypothetical protein [Afifella pfennigii]|uniref:hypothetical protein n=1 Tax=Afifella pfennigii TaxID=209897 RepID=UPI00047A3F2E|nr:hypothetical protein [Afifella pfennigii]
MSRYALAAIASAVIATSFAPAEAGDRSRWDGPDQKLELIVRDPSAYYYNNPIRRATTLEPTCRDRNVEVYDPRIGAVVLQRQRVCN